MSKPLPKPPNGGRPEDWSVAWFAELESAHERGDYRRATEARRELRRLGWSVARIEPHTRPHKGRHEADGQGVGQ